MSKITKTIFGLTLAASLIWVLLIFSAPFLSRLGSSLSSLTYHLFGSLCHQIPSRCFHLSGIPMPVCTRCFGIYAGFFLGTALYPSIKGWASLSIPSLRVFAVFSLPIIIDTAGNFFFAWQTPGEIRFMIGILWGLLLPYYFIPGISEAVRMQQAKNKK